MATLIQSHIKHSTDPSDSPSMGANLSPFKFTAALTAGLFLLAFTPRVQGNETLAVSVIGSAIVMSLWQIFQIMAARRSGQAFGFKLILRRQHYIQMMVQFSVYLYWGYYWRPVYDHLWLLAAQVLFAFIFDTSSSEAIAFVFVFVWSSPVSRLVDHVDSRTPSW